MAGAPLTDFLGAECRSERDSSGGPTLAVCRSWHQQSYSPGLWGKMCLYNRLRLWVEEGGTWRATRDRTHLSLASRVHSVLLFPCANVVYLTKERSRSLLHSKTGN